MRDMKAILIALVVIATGATALALSQPAAAPKEVVKRSAPSHDEWPDTRPGGLARRWVAAFSSGDEAMRDFLVKELAPESLAKRNIAARMKTYREARERFGKLMFVSVVKSSPAELKVKLMTSEGAQQEYVFAVQKEPPFKLIGVSRMQREHRLQGHFGGHR